MCDLFYPQMIDRLALWKLSNMFFGSTTSHDIPLVQGAVILGYCKCEGPIYDGIARAKVSGEARSIIIALVVQTVLPKIFRGVFECVADAREKGSTSLCLVRCNCITAVILLIVVASMAVWVFLLKFDPNGWRKAMLLSALNA